jgi:hypothetical protein
MIYWTSNLLDIYRICLEVEMVGEAATEQHLQVTDNNGYVQNESSSVAPKVAPTIAPIESAIEPATPGYFISLPAAAVGTAPLCPDCTSSKGSL